MKKQIENDERVLTQKRKIGSDAFQILFFGLLVSVLVQQYFFNAPFAQYAVEIVLFIAVSIYVITRNLMVGNDLFASKKGGQAIVVVNSLVCGFTVAVINTVLNYAKYGEKVKLPIAVNTALVAGITFISAAATAFVALELLYLVNKKMQKNIEERLNDNE